MNSRGKTYWCIVAVSALLTCAAVADVLREDVIEVSFEEGDRVLANDVLKTLKEGMNELSPRLPNNGAPIRVIICHTNEDFMVQAGRYAQPNVQGIAKPEEGIIALKSPRLLAGPNDYGGLVRHELVHILLERNVNPDNLPRWLNEGVAMLVSKEHRWEGGLLVGEMFLGGRLIPYRDLDLALASPGVELEFGDAYAQSLSLTRYLLRRLGEERFWALLRSLRAQSFGAALQAELGIYPPALWDDWTRSLYVLAVVFSVVSGLGSFQIMALLVVLAYWRKRRKGQAIMRDWAEEEAFDSAMRGHRVGGRGGYGVQSARGEAEDPEAAIWDDDYDDGYPWEEDDDDLPDEDDEEHHPNRRRR